MKREIIDSIMKYGDQHLIATEVASIDNIKKYAVRYKPKVGPFRTCGVAEQFLDDSSRSHDLCGNVGQISWWVENNPRKETYIKRLIRKLMAIHWIKYGRILPRKGKT